MLAASAAGAASRAASRTASRAASRTASRTASRAAGSWGRPFQLAPPGPEVAVPSQVAFSAAGLPAVAYGRYAVDDQAVAQAFTRVGWNGPSRRLAQAQEVLSLEFAGAVLEVLSGSSAPSYACCSSVQAQRLGTGARQTVVRGLAGVALGALLSLPGGTLAAVATRRGVWVARAAVAAPPSGGSGRLGSAGRFGRAVRLAGARAMPAGLALSPFAGARVAVAWTAVAPGRSGPNAAPQIDYALGSAAAVPRVRRVAITLPAGYAIGDLAVTPGGGGADPTAAWVQSWYDARGTYHSGVFALPLGPGVSAPSRAVSSPSRLASSVSLAGDQRGDQLLAWRSCDAAGACVAAVAVHPLGRPWGRPFALGGLDPTDSPVAAAARGGAALVGWIHDGHVYAEPLSLTAAVRAAVGRPDLVAGTDYASNLTLAAGPRGQALAAWTQGTLNESVVGARFTP